MSKNEQLTADEMKAERKRLATARGLLTRERNKLAVEREQLQAQTVEIEQQRRSWRMSVSKLTQPATNCAHKKLKWRSCADA